MIAIRASSRPPKMTARAIAPTAAIVAKRSIEIGAISSTACRPEDSSSSGARVARPSTRRAVAATLRISTPVGAAATVADEPGAVAPEEDGDVPPVGNDLRFEPVRGCDMLCGPDGLLRRLAIDEQQPHDTRHRPDRFFRVLPRSRPCLDLGSVDIAGVMLCKRASCIARRFMPGPGSMPRLCERLAHKPVRNMRQVFGRRRSENPGGPPAARHCVGLSISSSWRAGPGAYDQAAGLASSISRRSTTIHGNRVSSTSPSGVASLPSSVTGT